MRLRLLVAVVVALVLGALVAPRVLAGTDSSDPAYAQHDLDNISRSSGRHLADLTRPEWHVAMQEATAQSYLAALGVQLADLNNGRIHTGLGQWIPGGSVGDPEAYNTMPSRRVGVFGRTRAQPSGHVWGGEGGGRRPGLRLTHRALPA